MGQANSICAIGLITQYAEFENYLVWHGHCSLGRLPSVFPGEGAVLPFDANYNAKPACGLQTVMNEPLSLSQPRRMPGAA